MKLNRTPASLDRNARNRENENWELLEGLANLINSIYSDFDNIVDEKVGDLGTKIINHIKNTDFKNDLEHFMVLSGSGEVNSNGDAVITGDGSAFSTYGGVLSQSISSKKPIDEVWYARGKVRVLDEEATSVSLGFRGTTGTADATIIRHPEVNRLYDISHYYTGSDNFEGEFRTSVYASWSSGQNIGKRIEVLKDSLMAINLTEAFGKGQEPSKEEFDEFIDSIPGGFFENELGAGLLSKILLSSVKDVENAVNDLKEDVSREGSSSIKNETKNGDFSSDLYWVAGTGTEIVMANNTMNLMGNGENAFPRAKQVTDMPFSPKKKVYMRALVKPKTSKLDHLRLVAYSEVGGDTIKHLKFHDLKVDEQSKVSGILKLDEEGSDNVVIQIRTQYPDAESAEGSVVEVQKVIAIDLTETFGSGKEPTAEQMDDIVDGFSDQWFDGAARLDDLQKSILSFVFKDRPQGGVGFKRPIICVTFDDGFRSDIDLIYPAFKQRGIVGTSYIWTDRTDNNSVAMDPNDLIELKLNGWGIECHTRDHIHLADATDEQIHQQMQYVNADFERYGLPMPKHHALPYGSGGNDPRVYNIIRQYRKSVRNLQFNSSHVYNDWDTIDFSRLQTRHLNRPSVLQSIKNDMDLTFENNGILVIVIHEVVDSNPTGDYQNSINVVMDAMDYAIDKGFHFMTIDEMHRAVEVYKKLKDIK